MILTIEGKELKLANFLYLFAIFLFVFSIVLAVILFLLLENFIIPAIVIIVLGLMTALIFMALSANLKILMDIRDKKN